MYQYCSTYTITYTNTYTFIITIQYNMCHKHPLDAQNIQPIPIPKGG